MTTEPAEVSGDRLGQFGPCGICGTERQVRGPAGAKEIYCPACGEVPPKQTEIQG